MQDWMDNDREVLARTLMAEAGNQGPLGMLAAGSVIMNRARTPGYGDGVRGVILKPGQFSPWNSVTGYAGGEQGQNMAAIRPTSEAYEVADRLLSGQYEDPTGGATHFYNPDISTPSWGQAAGGDWARIGSHVFGRADAGRNGTGGNMQPQGLLSTSGQAEPERLPFFQRPETKDFLASVAIGLGGLTMNPNQAIIQSAQQGITERRKTREATAQKNQTIEFLRDRKRGDLIAAVEGGLPVTDALRLALTPPEAGYNTLTGAQLNAQYGTAFDESDLFNQSPSGQITKVGGGGVSLTNQLGAGETAWEKGMGEYGVKTYAEIQDAAVNATNMLNSTAQLEALMMDPDFQSGALTEPVIAGRKIIEALGGDPANVSSMEAFRAVTSRLILDSMGGSLGAGFSEGDRKFVESMQPSLDMSTAGNRLLIGIQNAVAKRKLQIAEFADRYVAENGRIDEKFNAALRQWAKENPLFPPSGDPSSYF